MTASANELKWFKSEGITDTPSTNGGDITEDRWYSGDKNSVFNDVSIVQAESGLVSFRKVWCKYINVYNDYVLNIYAFVHTLPEDGSLIEIIDGTGIDYESDITGTENRYGAMVLTQDANIGDTELVGVVPYGSTSFQNGYDVYLHGSGNGLKIDSVTIAQNGLQVTISLTPGTTLQTYFPTGSVVSALCPISDFKPTFPYTYSDSGGLDWSKVSGTNVGSIRQGNCVVDFDVDWGQDTYDFTIETGYPYGVSVDGVFIGYGKTNMLHKFYTSASATKPFIIIPPDTFSGEWWYTYSVAFSSLGMERALWVRREVKARTGAIEPAEFKLSVLGG